MFRFLPLALCLAIPLEVAAQSRTETPASLLERATARMGGDSVLAAIHSLRLDLITQWLRTSFAERPFADLPSYERSVELRDYRALAWRNSRYLSPSSPAPALVDVVRDTIAARLMVRAANASPTWGPLNIAYVDERRELFAFAPERLLVTLRRDERATLLPDTTLDGVRHARIAATVDGWPTVLFLRRSDGLPAMVRFRADETNDFGLAPWGEHDVEFWYSGWTRLPGGAVLPRQRDVRRVGRPYKRMTALTMAVNAPTPPDSFVIADSIGAAYLANERRPMWRAVLAGTARVERGSFAVLPPMVGSPGAVRVDGRWVMIEAAQATGAMDLVSEWLDRQALGPVAGAVASSVGTAHGGTPWFLARELPVYTAPGAQRALAQIVGSAAPRSAMRIVDRPQWARFGGDSLWLEPVSAPDMPGVLAVYSPTLRWLWLPFVGSPAHEHEVQATITRLERRGLTVDLLGGPRGFVMPRAR